MMSAKRPCILVIEDSAHIRWLIRDIFIADGFAVIEAEDGRRGLQLSADESPDCIILDLIMPDIDGIAMLKSLRDRGCETPVIIITAHAHESVRDQCLDLGAAGFVNKPLTRGELRNAVQKVLGFPPEP
jgi:twitching motility two-component system response regulator PilH